MRGKTQKSRTTWMVISLLVWEQRETKPGSGKLKNSDFLCSELPICGSFSLVVVNYRCLSFVQLDMSYGNPWMAAKYREHTRVPYLTYGVGGKP